MTVVEVAVMRVVSRGAIETEELVVALTHSPTYAYLWRPVVGCSGPEWRFTSKVMSCEKTLLVSRASMLACPFLGGRPNRVICTRPSGFSRWGPYSAFYVLTTYVPRSEDPPVRGLGELTF